MPAIAELQRAVSQRSILWGLAAIVVGMVYGTQLHDGKFGHPELTIPAHVQILVNGTLQLMGGLVLATPAACKFSSPLALQIFNFGNVYAPLFVFISEVVGAMWGLSWPRLVKNAGLPAPNATYFLIFRTAHYVPGVAYIVSWAVLLYVVATASTAPSSDKAE